MKIFRSLYQILGRRMMMELTITGLSPSFPVNNFTEASNIRPKSDQPRASETHFAPDAAILSLSPQALQCGRPKGGARVTENDRSQTAKSKVEAQLIETQKLILQQLRVRDLHVKMHEQQHLAAAGSYVRGGPTFQYTIGPDGKAYATGGEVQLDLSPIPNNPQATITKAQIVRQAALAPSDPSGADRAVAAEATQMENQARVQLLAKNEDNTGQSLATKGTRGGCQAHFYVKAYQNISRMWPIGNLFNQVA
jgi:hypothetical protein